MIPSADIRELRTDVELNDCVELLRAAFGTVAQEFGLTEESAPTNAAFTTRENLVRHLQGGMRLFGLICDSTLIGCVAIRRSKLKEPVYYIERLAVLPEKRHHGNGDTLLSFALKHIALIGGKVASIGMMDSNEILKEWYKSKGFIQHDCRRIEGLPFKVCYMSKKVR
jgi:ribosomal protein S18 acetylase RimI-like enzyme